MAYELPVKTITVDQMKQLIPWLGQEPVMETFKQYATKEQKALVAQYMKQNLSNEIIVVYGKYLMDGHHRVVAAIKSGQNMKKVDIYDLPE